MPDALRPAPPHFPIPPLPPPLRYGGLRRFAPVRGQVTASRSPFSSRIMMMAVEDTKIERGRTALEAQETPRGFGCRNQVPAGTCDATRSPLGEGRKKALPHLPSRSLLLRHLPQMPLAFVAMPASKAGERIGSPTLRLGIWGREGEG